MNPETTMSTENTSEELSKLRSLLALALVCLIVLSASVNLFLYKQVRTISAQVVELDARNKALVEDFNKNQKNLYTALVNNLGTYARTDANYALIFQKYQAVLAPQQPAGAPAPGAPAAPAKK